MKENMISTYFIIPLAIGIVLSYIWLIHHFWLRSVFRDYHKPTLETKIDLKVGISASSNLERTEKMIAAQSSCRTMKIRI